MLFVVSYRKQTTLCSGRSPHGERGLKSQDAAIERAYREVAPPARGAWIEIGLSKQPHSCLRCFSYAHGWLRSGKGIHAHDGNSHDGVPWKLFGKECRRLAEVRLFIGKYGGVGDEKYLERV